MKKIIGIMTLFIMSQSVFAEEMATQPVEAKQTETKLLESDVAPTTEAASEEVIKKEQSGFSRGSVVRSAFTREIDEREPMENLQNLTNDNGQVKFFTELRDMSGQTAIHRWEYDGKVVAEVEFNVKGPRWRVWSSKSFVPQWTGNWKVSIVNGAGEVISEKTLSYDVATAPIAAPDTAPVTTTTPEATESMQ